MATHEYRVGRPDAREPMNHRFPHLVSRPQPVAAGSVAPAGFMPCPMFLIAATTSDQQSFIRRVYELARAQAEAVARPSAREPHSPHVKNCPAAFDPSNTRSRRTVPRTCGGSTPLYTLTCCH